jgi:hypothetical protein
MPCKLVMQPVLNVHCPQPSSFLRIPHNDGTGTAHAIVMKRKLKITGQESIVFKV